MILLYTNWGSLGSRRAKTYFSENNKKFVEKNIQKFRLTEEELKYILSKCENGTEDIISTRSKVYKNMKGDVNDLTTTELIQLIQDHPNILRLPVILSDQMMFAGWDDEEVELASRMA